MDIIIDFLKGQSLLEWLGLIFGLLAVILLIWENILTWPAGILYVVVSLPVFWEAKLYQDFILHVFFGVMNVYGWLRWSKGKEAAVLHISLMNYRQYAVTFVISVIAVLASGYFFDTYTDTDFAYPDATTTILSFVAMWLTAEKKFENWVIWLVVDIVASVVYFVKGIYPYFLLYLIYCGLAFGGMLNWWRLYKSQKELSPVT